MKKLYWLVIAVVGILAFPNLSLAGRGCCSWHGGQNYCDSSVGRRVCNDNTYSPTCTCPIIKKPVIKKTLTCKTGYILSKTGKSCVKKK